MAGWTGPLARALESFEPWQGIDCSAITAALHRDPAYLAEQAAGRAALNAAIDRGMAPLNARQAARWAAEEAEGRA